MPLPKGTRYAVTTTKTGKKIRLAFAKGAPKKGAKPIEAKNISSGETHTPAEFAAETKRPSRRYVKPRGRRR